MGRVELPVIPVDADKIRLDVSVTPVAPGRKQQSLLGFSTLLQDLTPTVFLFPRKCVSARSYHRSTWADEFDRIQNAPWWLPAPGRRNRVQVKLSNSQKACVSQQFNLFQVVRCLLQIRNNQGILGWAAERPAAKSQKNHTKARASKTILSATHLHGLHQVAIGAVAIPIGLDDK